MKGRFKMKINKINLTLAFISLILFIGFIGGIDRDLINVWRGFAASLVCLVVFAANVI